ncbi:MAG: caspase family protein [Desulfobacterales bacterium]|nr:MAG: caspase family protein [Desulfobacterales bacterium]
MADKNNKLSGFWSYLFWLLLMSLALVSTSRGEDRALLIGVGRYAHFEEKLNGVSLDLGMMKELSELMGFKEHAIKVLENEQASTAGVYDAIENWLIRDTGPQDRILLYFSGHGSQVPDENDDEKDHFDEVLLLYDVTLTQRQGRLTLNGVLHDDHFANLLAKMKSRHILVILDACHSGSATRSIRLPPRSIPIHDAQVKYFYYSPMLEAAGGSGRFDVMEPDASAAAGSRYVAISACRDDEQTIATAQGSIFTLGLREALRSAARDGKSISPQDLQRRTALFIQEQLGSKGVGFHPQIAGQKSLRERPLELVSLAGRNGVVRQNLEALVHKSHAAVWINLNKTCFEAGDTLVISVGISEPGYLNVVSVRADDRPKVLFPNQYHRQNAVDRGVLTIPTRQMNFELVTDGPPGTNLITAFLTRSPLNSYSHGFKDPEDKVADLSPGSMRSLMLRQKQDWLAAGKVAVEIKEVGQCR